MKKASIVISVFFLSLVAVVPVFAADIVAPNQEDKNISIPSTETHKNLYAAAGNVTVSGPVAGDLVAAGGMVTIEGTVEQDVLAAGGTLDIRGDIGGDARIGGGNITVASKISGDLVVAGGNVTLTDKSSVQGDLVVAGGMVSINGPIHGNVRLAGGTATINATVDGVVSARSKELVFEPNAKVVNVVDYKGQKEAVVKAGAQVPNIHFTRVSNKGIKDNLKALIAGAFIVKLIAWILAGLLLIKLKKNWVESILTSVSMDPWKSAGYGVVGFVVIPLVTFLLLVLLVGYYIAFILGTSFALLLLFANLVSSIVLGALIIRLLTRSVESVVDWQAVVIGVVIWSLLKWIPVVGAIVCFIFLLVVFGALLINLKEKHLAGTHNS